jgi:hypothetical protein
MAIYGFMISERETTSGAHCSRRLKTPSLPASYRPRGSPDPAAAARPQLDLDPSSQAARRNRPHPAALPMLRARLHTKDAASSMTLDRYAFGKC